MTINIFETITQSTLSRVSSMVQNQTSLTVRINSNGGDVFAALAIYNLLKPLNVTVEIIGLCASAATIIACAGKVVRMGASGRFMIHSPSVMLFDQYDKQTLEKLSTTLGKMEESVLSVYRSRVKDFKFTGEELWLSAAQAKELGFVDEIINEVRMFGGMFGMEENFFSKLKATITEALGSTPTDNVRAAELSRIRELESLRGASPAVNAVIEVAIRKGQSASEVVDYVNAVKNAPTSQDAVADKIVAIILDQMTSGAQGVTDTSAPTQEEVVKARQQKMIAFANGLT